MKKEIKDFLIPDLRKISVFLILAVVLFLFSNITMASNECSEQLSKLEKCLHKELICDYFAIGMKYDELAKCFEEIVDTKNSSRYYDKAIEYYIKGANEAFSDRDYENAAIQYGLISKIYEKRGNRKLYDEYQIKIADMLIEEAEVYLDRKDYDNTARYYGSAAITYEKINKKDLAKEYYRKAAESYVKAAESWLEKNDPNSAFSDYDIASWMYLIKINDVQKSKEIAKRVLDSWERYNLTEIGSVYYTTRIYYTARAVVTSNISDLDRAIDIAHSSSTRNRIMEIKEYFLELGDEAICRNYAKSVNVTAMSGYLLGLYNDVSYCYLMAGNYNESVIYMDKLLKTNLSLRMSHFYYLDSVLNKNISSLNKARDFLYQEQDSEILGDEESRYSNYEIMLNRFDSVQKKLFGEKDKMQKQEFDFSIALMFFIFAVILIAIFFIRSKIKRSR
ncbi:MAG: hypothetical protein QW802_03430 [Candidatus Altiarchaeota archaeon]